MAGPGASRVSGRRGRLGATVALVVAASLALTTPVLASPSSAASGAATAALAPLTPADWVSVRNRAPSGGFNPAETALSPATVGGLRLLSRTPVAQARVDRDAVGATGHGLFFRAASPSGIAAVDQVTGATVWSAPQGSGAIALLGDSVYTVDAFSPVLLAYHAGTGALRWQVPLPGEAPSSPTVVGSRIVLSVVEGFGRRLGKVVSVSAATGRVLRRTTLDAPGGVSHVAVRNGTAVVTGFSGRVFGLDIGTGRQLWAQRLAGDGSAFTISPVIRAGRVFVTHGRGVVRALDLASGRQLWSHDLGCCILTSAAEADGLLYVAAQGDKAGDQDLFAYDSGTGALRWSRASGASNSSPTVANGVLYVGTLFGGSALKAYDAATGTRLGAWSMPSPQSEPMVSAGKVYVYGERDGSFSVSTWGLAPSG